jgi:hypothetical protein
VPDGCGDPAATIGQLTLGVKDTARGGPAEVV